LLSLLLQEHKHLIEGQFYAIKKKKSRGKDDDYHFDYFWGSREVGA